MDRAVNRQGSFLWKELASLDGEFDINLLFNEVVLLKESKLFNNIPANEKFYFEHSYYIPVNAKRKSQKNYCVDKRF